MKTIAKTLLASMNSQFSGEFMGGKVAINNNETIEFLNDECVHVQDLCGQETWTMVDGSFITRDDDLYYEGNDIDDFEINHKEEA